MGNNTSSRISTFHGFCHELLKEDIHYLHYPANFVIMDSEDQKQILHEIYDELHITGKDFPYQKTLRDISHLKYHKQSYVKYVTNPNLGAGDGSEISAYDRPLQGIFDAYLLHQRKNFMLDYDDLILFTEHILTAYDEVKKKWNDRIKYIQVDEFQDVNLSQWTLLTHLLGENKNLFVVGDPDQNIYSWRGAEISIFLGLPDFAENKIKRKFIDFVLDDNYRSLQPILGYCPKFCETHL